MLGQAKKKASNCSIGCYSLINLSSKVNKVLCLAVLFNCDRHLQLQAQWILLAITLPPQKPSIY